MFHLALETLMNTLFKNLCKKEKTLAQMKEKNVFTCVEGAEAGHCESV